MGSDRDALEAGGTGQAIDNVVKKFPDEARKAKAVVQKGIHASARGVQGTANAGRATVELARMIKQKGAKETAKSLAKNGGKQVARISFSALKKILLSVFGPVLIIAILFVVIFANTPAMILVGMSGVQKETSEVVTDVAVEIAASAVPGSSFSSIVYAFQQARDWYYEIIEGKITVESTGEEVTQEELDRLNAAGDYDGVLTFYTEVTQHYLDMEFDDTVTKISNYANSCSLSYSGENTTYDVSKTMATIGENPFTNIDYANIIACYSITDDYETALLSRYKTKMRKAEFLKYTLERQSTSYSINIYDEEGNIAETITKTILWDEVTLIPYSATEIFDLFQVDPNEIYHKSKSSFGLLNKSDGTSQSEITNEQAYSEYYTTLRNKLEVLGFAGGGSHISATTYGNVLTAEEIEGYLAKIPSGTSKNRKQVIKVALNVVGRIPYNNTGQRSYPYYGWNSDWGKPSGNAKHPYVGIDCSGFVQWVFRNAWCDEKGENSNNAYQSMYTTGMITGSKNIEKIARSELKPGDLGTIRMGGSSDSNWNHVGIYMGNDRWVHCSGSSGTVVVSDNYNSFTCYFRVKTDACEKENYWKEETYLPFMQSILDSPITGISEDEITTIATTLHGEFGSDNGFRACAEAVYHYSKYSKKSMYETVKIKNYLDAYTKLYITHEWNPDQKRATSGQLKMLEDVMKGNLIHFPSSKYPYPVMYFNTTEIGMTGWRSKGVIVETIPATYSTVVYFYCKGVTYNGYK